MKKQIKFRCVGNFVPLKMARIILIDWGIKEISNVQQIDDHTFLITNENTIKKQTQNLYKNIIQITDSEVSPVHILSISGQLSTFGQNSKKIFYPTYLVQITIANCIAILLLQLVLRKQKSQQRVYKLSCIQCIKYFGAFSTSALQSGIIDRDRKRGQNVLEGGAACYGIYQCKEGLLAVGNLQYKFHQQMIKNIGLNEEQERYFLQNQLNMEQWKQMRKKLQKKLKQNTASYWQNLLKDKDTCVTQIKQQINLPKDYIHPFVIRPKL